MIASTKNILAVLLAFIVMRALPTVSFLISLLCVVATALACYVWASLHRVPEDHFIIVQNYSGTTRYHGTGWVYVPYFLRKIVPVMINDTPMDIIPRTLRFECTPFNATTKDGFELSVEAVGYLNITSTTIHIQKLIPDTLRDSIQRAFVHEIAQHDHGTRYNTAKVCTAANDDFDLDGFVWLTLVAKNITLTPRGQAKLDQMHALQSEIDAERERIRREGEMFVKEKNNIIAKACVEAEAMIEQFNVLAKSGLSEDSAVKLICASL